MARTKFTARKIAGTRTKKAALARLQGKSVVGTVAPVLEAHGTPSAAQVDENPASDNEEGVELNPSYGPHEVSLRLRSIQTF
jgi:hypothetical protein